MEPNNLNDRLRELHGSGFEIVDGEPNIIGWTIRDNTNHKIGVVDDLLFDAEQQKVRYIIANLKNNDFDLDKRRVLLPIGVAKLHEKNDDVVLSSISAWQLRALPTYSKRLTDSDERDIFSVFSTTSTSTTSDQTGDTTYQRPQNFYDQSQFEYDNLFSNRRAGKTKEDSTQRSFRMREGYQPNDNSYQRGTDKDEVTSPDRRIYEEEESLVSSPSQSPAFASDNRDQNAGNERILDKIQRMQSELKEIEKDLRTGRVL